MAQVLTDHERASERETKQVEKLLVNDRVQST